MVEIRTRKDLYKAIYEDAKSFLLELDGVDKQLLEKHLNDYKENPENLSAVMNDILLSVKNKRNMSKSITEEKIEKIRDHMWNFNPEEVINNYGYDLDEAAERISETIEEIFSGEISIDMKNGHAYWSIFVKSIYTSALFLSNFSDINDFRKFIESFQKNAYTQISLPLLLSKEIAGLGFALSCDFIKESISPKYIKPDVHIKYIFKECKISKTDNDLDVFKAGIEFSKEIGEIPYKVDKVFWLIGSGNFYLTEDIRTGRRKEKFVKQIKEKYGKDIERLCG